MDLLVEIAIQLHMEPVVAVVVLVALVEMVQAMVQ